jgi:MFS family permease
MNESSLLRGVQSRLSIRSRSLLIGLYFVVALLFWMSLYFYLPTLPTYAQSKSENLAVVGVILAQYGLWQAIVRLPLGIVSDWAGRRKPFILVGILLAGVGAWVMGSADGASGLLVGRAITGLAASIWVPLIVVFSSLFPPEEAVRASAIMTFAGSAGRVIATSSTGMLNDIGGYSLAFVVSAGVALLGLVFLLPAREETHPPRRPSVGSIGRLISRRDVLLPSLLAAVAEYATWAVPFGFLPILAEQLGATDVVQSMLVSLQIGVVILGSLVAAAIASRIGARRLSLICFVVLSAGIGGAALAPSLPAVFVAQFFIGLSQGVSYPVLMGLSIRHVADAERTSAMGLHQAVYAGGMFAGPWLSGILADALGIRPMFGLTAFACIAVSTVLIRLLPGKGLFSGSRPGPA